MARMSINGVKTAVLSLSILIGAASDGVADVQSISCIKDAVIRCIGGLAW